MLRYSNGFIVLSVFLKKISIKKLTFKMVRPSGGKRAAAGKRRRYNLAGASLVPLALEDGGRPAEETVAFVRRCGAAAEERGATWPLAAAGDEQPVTARLWQEYSTLLQLGNAELVLSANGR